MTVKMARQPFLPVTVSVKKIKGTAHQFYADCDRVALCDRAFINTLQIATISKDFHLVHRLYASGTDGERRKKIEISTPFHFCINVQADLTDIINSLNNMKRWQ